MVKQEHSILFLGKKEDEYTEKGLRFCQLNFSNVVAHLGEWGEPLPEDVKQWEGDIIISYLSRWVIPEQVLKKAKVAAINFHPAPPEYPGIGCINFALYNQATEYGVTCHHMTSQVNVGPIIAVRRFPIFPTDDVSTLLRRSYDHQISLFYEMIDLIILGKKLPTSKERWKRKPYTRKDFNELLQINLETPNQEENNKRIRATRFDRSLFTKRRYTYFKGEKDKEISITTTKKYYTEKSEMDKYLEQLITPFIQKKKLKILDACCGGGQLISLLSELSPQSTFLGVDQTGFLIDEAKNYYKDQPNISFEKSDIYNLPLQYEKAFDLAINWRTATGLPYYDDLLRSLVRVTKKHVFLSSLFYDGDIDFEIKIREYKKEEGRDKFNSYYNVYSLPRFKEFVYKLGVKNIEVYDFEINTDIPKGSIDYMGTYTVKLENGKRLQISGSIVMSWKIIRIDL